MAEKEKYYQNFLKLCLQHAKIDQKYTVLDYQDGIFLDEYVEFAFQVFCLLSSDKTASRVRDNFHYWRVLNYGESKKSGAFFAYVDALRVETVSQILYRWFELRGDNQSEKEVMYRAFILAGMTTQQDPIKGDE